MTFPEKDPNRKIVQPSRQEIISEILEIVSSPCQMEEIIQDDLLNFCIAVQKAMDYGNLEILKSYFIQKLYKQTRRNLEDELNIP